MIYENNWESLNTRPVPAWFGDAKFGIFIHWGIYSVPAYTRRGGYAEWYGNHIHDPKNAVRIFHDRVYGPQVKYTDFVRDFRAELFDADEWAELFENAGARYINITSKHHDGFCLFKTSYAPFWNSVDVGPHRDICAELKKACDKTEHVKFGVYHSICEWWNPIAKRSLHEYSLTHLHPMMKELIENYQPHTLFTDGEWEEPAEMWHSTEFLTWLYNESSVRDFIVPNDRWGKETRGRVGGNFTTEYGEIEPGRYLDPNCGRPFEECRGIGRSFGFNRNEHPEDYQSSKALLIMLCDLVSKGGNMLLNVGPAADGTIPTVMQERLLDMGKWLRVNGEAIYGSKVYDRDGGEGVYYTQNNGSIYAIVERYPYGRIVFDKIPFADGMKAEILGCDAKITVFNADGKLGADVPFVSPDYMKSSMLYTFKISR